MAKDFIGPSTLSVTQAAAAFFTFLPSLPEVRRANRGDETSIDVRNGLVAASVVSVGVGAIISALTSDPTPSYVAAVVALILIVVYEVTLRQPGES